MDRFNDECAVFGIYGVSDAAAHVVLGLHALQHRGQEASGIVASDGEQFFTHRALGHVADNFGEPGIVEKLRGHFAIGHNRYSTSGESLLRNVQPIFAELSFGGVAIAHNGNLTNAQLLRKELVSKGCIFQSTMDTEVIIHLIALSRGKTLVERLTESLKKLEGAYSLLVMTEKEIIAARDPYGVRPLSLGKLGDSSYVIASETCGFDIIGAEYVREVQPGEVVVINADGFSSVFMDEAKKPKRFCIFEYVYFSRPDSIVEGLSVYESRKQIGCELAKESPVIADIVVPVPDSGVPAALGFAAEAKIPFELGIIRNHYVGRTFIEPTDNIRHLGVKLKHNANTASIAGKRVVLVDDSIVRGTTSKKIVNMVREAGAKEVHMRIASPPTTDSCFYGVDTPEKDKLLAANYNVEEMRKLIGVDSLAFISIDGLYRAMGESARNNKSPQYCDACFTGDYPIPLTDFADGKKSGKKSIMRQAMEKA